LTDKAAIIKQKNDLKGKQIQILKNTIVSIIKLSITLLGRGKYYFTFFPQSSIHVFGPFFICLMSLYLS
jgi:hypothetical protein